MSEGHALATKPTLSIKRLTHTCWVLFQKQVHPSEKVQYKNIHHILNSEEALHLLSETGGITFLPQATAMRSARPGMVFRPLSDLALMLDTRMAVRADNSSRLVSEFVRAFMKKSAQMAHVAKDEQQCLPMGA